ncbi:MAG: hypothetical protein R3C32_13920 [Chloroflexota bacterium]
MTRGTAVGQDIHYDALLPAGEYRATHPSQPSDQPYRLDVRRQDPSRARRRPLSPTTTRRWRARSRVGRGRGDRLGQR